MAQAEGQGDDPTGGAAVLVGFEKLALDLRQGVRLDLLLIELRGLGDGGRVDGEVAATLSLVERRPDGAVGLVRSSCRTAGFLHALVEAFQVLRLKLLQAVSTDAGYEVVGDGHAIAVDGVSETWGAAMFSTQWGSHVSTVQRRPALRTVQASWSFSGSRTALVTSARLLRVTWRRSGLPSSSMPTVTYPCQRLSLAW
ncbi:hypothetical protein V2S66_05090 [Streptomyces sp. V4-01]|uniref:Uncharacterized protein n=1 Tax=Actinacidiphila polyblastidii TaxID=3110430 RepID=A0ABU7P693_9ACTN|nr:hypothetical protein [Streptomyces sp. V4-01]